MNREILDEIKFFIGSYLIPAYEREYVDPQLRADFRKVIDEVEEDYGETEHKHIHVSGTTVGKPMDECAKCGLDIRDNIHVKEENWDK